MKREFITFGFEFNLNELKPIRNRRFCGKPDGGLWGSPVDSNWGWKDWCESEDFYKHSGLEKGFTWTLSDSARILILDSMESYQNLQWNYKILYSDMVSIEVLNFERVSRDYDAILLTESGLDELRGDLHLGFFTWDCESILVLNPECIENIKSITNTLNLEKAHDY